MAIKSKTRKILWAKSGNRCALCRIELVQNEIQEDNVIIGEECHIVSSSKENGPRGQEILHCKDFDDYDNLILLCANDHKRIDTMVDIYPVDKLILIKKMHEEWVKETLSIDPTTFTNDRFKITCLKKVESGAELVKIIDGAHAFMFDNDHLKTSSEVKIIPPLFDLLEEYGDVLDLMSFSDKAQLGLDLTDTIQKIENLEFILFGIKRNVKLRNEKKKNMGRWDMATVVAVRNDNPGIVDGYLITKTPDQYRFKI